MNRAVQARLDNPDIPLYHALRDGGFDFPANEDASTMDGDQVTLGQRKNQLLRRLRQIARKKENEAAEGSVSEVSGLGKQPFQAAETSSQATQEDQANLLNTKRSYDQAVMGTQDSAVGALGVPVPPAAKRVAASQQQQHPAGSSMHTMANQSFSNHQALNPMTERPISAQRFESSFGGNTSALADTNHQLYQHLNHSLGTSALPGTMSLDHNFLPFTQAAASGPTSFPSAAAVPPYLLQSLTQQHQANTSAAMHPYLSATAAGAPNQSSSSLTPMPMPPHGGNAADQKQLFALQLFQQKVQTLYGQCMLAAGYSADDTIEQSQCFRGFAFVAWKQECERLQGILGNDSFLPADGGGGGAGSGTQQQQQHQQHHHQQQHPQLPPQN